LSSKIEKNAISPKCPKMPSPRSSSLGVPQFLIFASLFQGFGPKMHLLQKATLRAQKCQKWTQLGESAPESRPEGAGVALAQG
jgi:hypothetical protein